MENKTPISLLTDLLAEMTERALNAESELVLEKVSSDTWYKAHQVQKEEIAALRKENEETKKLLAEYLTPSEIKGCE